jgi:uncharacterized protein with von Willebrand factor type A (vWA) domain
VGKINKLPEDIKGTPHYKNKRSDGTSSSINSTEKVSKYKNKRTRIFLV